MHPLGAVGQTTESNRAATKTNKMDITYRPIEEKDNKEIADLIRGVFMEFNIHRPGPYILIPTTDNLFGLFRTPGSEYWIAEENGVIMGGCGVYPTPGLPEGCAELVKFYLSSGIQGQRDRMATDGKNV